MPQCEPQILHSFRLPVSLVERFDNWIAHRKSARLSSTREALIADFIEAGMAKDRKGQPRSKPS